jgi:alpha-galactosidase
MEAQRIGLQVIRDTVGDEVILDKDGSPMLNPVGLVDTGRVSVDTGHSFQRTKNAAPGIAARFYMHRNFFVNDPDAFNITDKYIVESKDAEPSLSLGAAQASIALSAVSGGMYEIGDDMLVLGSERDRLALVENRELLNMAKVGRAHTPVDLMTYQPEDEQPSVFFLQESQRQAILTVFNWTNTARSHTLKFADLGLHTDHRFAATDVLNQDESVAIEGGTVRIENQPPHSVKVIKIIDRNFAEAAPTITAQVPLAAAAGETINLWAQARADGVPAVAYHWDFGDGTSADGSKASHSYTTAADFVVRLTVDGVDGVPAQQTFSIKATGNLRATPSLTENRRFVEPTDR